MGFVFDQFQTGKLFRGARVYYYFSNLSFRVFVGASDVLNAKEKNRYVENRNHEN